MSSDPDDFSKFTGPRMDEEAHQAELAPLTFSRNPEDGMPQQVVQGMDDYAPPLNESTLICMADTRSFVFRYHDGSVMLEWMPDAVKRAPAGFYYVLVDEIPQKLRQEVIETARGLGQIHFARDSLYEVIEVQPVRPVCGFYHRVHTDLVGDRTKRFVQRVCTAQKTEEGEYYSLRDGAVFACSLRAPRHLESEEQMEEFDRRLIQIGRKKEEPEFSVEAALAAERTES